MDNLIADKLLGENGREISEKLSRAIAQMSDAQTLQIAKSKFRYVVEMELILYADVFGNYRLYSKRN